MSEQQSADAPDDLDDGFDEEVEETGDPAEDGGYADEDGPQDVATSASGPLAVISDEEPELPQAAGEPGEND